MKRKQNLLDNPDFRVIINILEPTTVIGDINYDNLIRNIISPNINMFLALSLTSKSLQQLLNSDPDIYFDLYKEVFRDECIILDLLSNESLLQNIMKINNNEKILDKMSLIPRFTFGRHDNNFYFNVMGIKKKLDKDNINFREEEERINRQKEDIFYYTSYFLKEKLIKSLKYLLTSESYYEQEKMNEIRKFFDPDYDKLNELTYDERKEKSIYLSKEGLLLQNAEYFFESFGLIIEYFLELTTVCIPDNDRSKNGLLFQTVRDLFDYSKNMEYISLETLEKRLIILFIQIEYYIIDKESNKSIDYNIGKGEYIIRNYLIDIRPKKIDKGVRDSIFFIFSPNEYISQLLVDLHKRVKNDIERIKKTGDRLYYETIDYKSLKHKVCQMAFSNTKPGDTSFRTSSYINELECNKFWKDLLVNTNALYMIDQGRRSSHYLMHKPFCFNCKEKTTKIDTQLQTHFCSINCQEKTYDIIKSSGLI